MLPILRIIPVGGVFLAIAILVLAFRPPEGFRSQFPASAPARGALIEQADHPEWRQFLILAAIQRADEIGRLRKLPDTPVRNDKPQPAVAGLPADRNDADPDDVLPPAAAGPTLPMEIGEPSSTELPVSKQEEKPPAITPALLKSGFESRVHRPRRAAAKPKPETSKAYVGDDAYQAKAGSINY